MLKLSQKNITEDMEVNTKIAGSQDEFVTIPSYKTKSGICAFAFELDAKDVQQIIEEKKIYLLRITRGKDFQPMNISLNQEEFHNQVIETDHELRVFDAIAKIKRIAFKDQSIKDVDLQAAERLAIVIADASETYSISDEKLWERYMEERKHLIIDREAGFSEYDGTDLADYCFDLPDDIPKHVETIEFRGHKYDLKKYQAAEKSYCAIDRDWLKIETTKEFLKLIKTTAMIAE